MSQTIQGRSRRFGDDVNTDYIIRSTRKRETLDVAILKRYLFETVDPRFAASVMPGDLIVAGRNFGCGSAMEIAVTVIQAAGINAVLAVNFSRTFFRNAVNNGLLPIECDTSSIGEGDVLDVQIDETTVITNVSAGQVLTGRPVTGIARDVLDAGGLVPYLRRHGRFQPM